MDSQAKIAAGECQVAIDQRLERLILSAEGADGEFTAAAAVVTVTDEGRRRRGDDGWRDYDLANIGQISRA